MDSKDSLSPTKLSRLEIVNLLNVVKDIAIPTAVITAVGYYIGWSMATAYFLSFGLPIGLINTSIPAALTTAWPELLVGILSIFMGYLIYQITKEHFTLSTLLTPYRSIRFFFINTCLSVVLGTLTLLTLVNFIRLPLTYPTNLSFIFYIFILLPFLITIWTSYVLGNKINSAITNDIRGVFSIRLFKSLFPESRSYLVLISILVILIISRAGFWRGYYLAERDIHNPQRLIGVTLHSQDIYPLEYIYNPDTKLYSYKNLKLIDASDKYIFVLQESRTLSNTASLANTFTTYALPRKDSLILELNP